MSIPDEGYSRNVSCTLNSISTSFLLDLIPFEHCLTVRYQYDICVAFKAILIKTGEGYRFLRSIA